MVEKKTMVQEEYSEKNNNDTDTAEAVTIEAREVEKSAENEDDTGNNNNTPLSPYFSWSGMPLMAAQVYYYSPWTALASGLGGTAIMGGGSFQNVWLLLLLLSLEEGSRHPSSIPLTALWLALSSYMELHYVVFLIPLTLWLQRKEERRRTTEGTPSHGTTKVYSK